MTDVQQPQVEEMKAAFQGPAVFANKVVLNTGIGSVRLSFLEEMAINQEKQTIFRSAICMNYPDAIALANLLKSALSDLEKKMNIMNDNKPKDETQVN
jgi:hypothetical protein